ncbi:MAG: PQQ-binding-like beta-propeller repeat protein [Oligoflexia bacterium]|nr:PQQ-binding-like beta-propeller repeat protein [Oligoflexia bacterium]
MTKKVLLNTIAFSLLVAGCSTAPKAKKARLEVDWVRSTLKSENWGYRRTERMAPMIDGEFVLQGNSFDSVVAYHKVTGQELWRKTIRNGAESGFAIEGTSLFFGAGDGQFYAVNKLSGKTLWSFPTRSENLAPALVNGGVVYFLAGNNVLYALDSKTGKQLWIYNRGDVSSLSIRGGSRPTIYKGTLYIGFSDGYLAAVDSRDGNLLWERKLTTNIKFVDVDATPVVDENSIWVASYDGALYCLSRKDGQVTWRLDDGGAVSVLLEGDTLYYGSQSQQVYALNKMTGAEKWKYQYPEHWGVPTQPVLHKGLILFGTSLGDLVALSAQTGRFVTSFRTGTGIYATPAIDSERSAIYAMSNQANLFTLALKWSSEEDMLKWANW